ncbi:MAG: oligosaccharide flippase family protein [Microthrixaceae bacterium]
MPVRDEGIGRKAVGGFLWALAGFLIMQVGSFATYTYATRVLGTAGIAVVGTALTVVFWIDILLDLGMGASLIYEQERGQTHRVAVAFTVNVVVATTIAAFVALGAGPIDRFFKVGDIDIFRVVALLIAVKGLGQVPDALLKRDLDFRRRAASDLTRSTLRFVIAVALLKAGVGPIAMVIAVAVAEVAAVAVTWILVRFRPRFRFDKAVATEMLRFGAAMFGARLVGMLWLNGDYLVITHHFGGRSKQFGNYFTAFRLPELVLGSVYNLFSNVAFPAYAAARERGAATLRTASLKSLRMLCLFGFPAGFGMSLVARDFIGGWFGAEFAGAVPVMEWLCAAAAFVAVGYASGDLYAAIGKPRLGLYFNLVFAPVLVAGFVAVVGRGVVAIAMVHLAVIIPYSMFRIEVANRLLGTTWSQSLGALRPATAATLGMVALALPVRLLLAQGWASMFAIVAAGATGMLAGLAVGDRATLGELLQGGRSGLARLGLR